jgi:hypothetical protein
VVRPEILAVDHAKRSVVLPETLVVDNAKLCSPRGSAGGPRYALFSQRFWRWTTLSVVLPEIMAVDHAKRGSPRDSGGGPR